MSTLNDLKNAKDKLTDALSVTNAAEHALARAKSLLATREARLWANGLEGKNAEERKANLALQCITEQEAVNSAEAELRDAKLAKEIAELVYKVAREANANYRAELLARAPEEALA